MNHAAYPTPVTWAPWRPSFERGHSMMDNGELPKLAVRFKSGDRYVDLTLVFAKEGDRITAHCDELGTAQFGETFEDAHEAIIEAVSMHLNTLDEAEELERFSREHGIQIFRESQRWLPASEAEAVYA